MEARRITAEEHAQGYAICGCEKFAFVWRAELLRWLPTDYHGELCPKSGVEEKKIETIIIGPKKTSARGHRYLTPSELNRQIAAGLLTVLKEERDKSGALKRVRVESVRHVKSDTALIDEVLGRE